MRPPGPLHSLPVPDQRGSSIAMDFIGPLPTDEGYDCILTITDRLGSDIRIIPTKTTITAEELTVTFFDTWYCENGLLNDIVCDRDKIFVSRFWKVLTKLTGVKLKMSQAATCQNLDIAGLVCNLLTCNSCTTLCKCQKEFRENTDVAANLLE